MDLDALGMEMEKEIFGFGLEKSITLIKLIQTMIENRKIKSNLSIKQSLNNEKIFQSRRSVACRPVSTFTSVPIKLVKYHLSKPITSRTKFIESIQKCTILCFRCKKLKPNTFLRESQVSPNKICDCSSQIHSIKIQKPQEKKPSKPKSENYDYIPLYAEGKSIQSTPGKIRRLNSEHEAQKYLNEEKTCKSKLDLRSEGLGRFKYLIFKGNNSEVVRDALKRREQWVEGHYSITCTVNLIWHPLSTGIKFDRLKSFLPVQVVNHFEFHTELSNKISLYRNLSKYCKKNSIDLKLIVPDTFIFETKLHNYRQSLDLFRKNLELTGKTVWILKPSSLNRGRGIEVFNSLEKFDEICSSFDDSINFVVQQYIENPLLFNKRKFDIRMWVLINHDNSVYVFKQGYIRTSSECFSLFNNLDNKFVHLTNNAVQKESKSYGRFESGNQVSFKEFEIYLMKEKGKDFNEILEEILKLIEISVLAVKNKLNPRGRNFCFEIFGYDFIIDDQCKPWLIEVNTNPCLELSSPLLAQLIPRMIEEAFDLAIDPLFTLVNKNKLEVVEVVDLPEGSLWNILTKL